MVEFSNFFQIFDCYTLIALNFFETTVLFPECLLGLFMTIIRDTKFL